MRNFFKGYRIKPRIAYRPEWNSMKPWAVFIDGTHVNSYATEEEAKARLAKEGAK